MVKKKSKTKNPHSKGSAKNPIQIRARTNKVRGNSVFVYGKSVRTGKHYNIELSNPKAKD